MRGKMLTTKSPTPKPSLPQTIFSHFLSIFDIPLIKRIVSIFHQQNRFRKREPRNSLLQKLARLEQARSETEKAVIEQLIRLGLPITRAAVKNGPLDEDVDNEAAEKSERRECEVCLDILAVNNFPEQFAGATCNHKTFICTPCIRQTVTIGMKILPWNNMPCPFSGCKNILEPDMVRRYLQGAALDTWKIFRITTFMQRLIGKQL